MTTRENKKRTDRAAAKDAAYKGSENPFPEGSRRHRYFISYRRFVETMDAAFRDLEQVYGPMGQKRC